MDVKKELEEGRRIVVSTSNPKLLENKTLIKACIDVIIKYNKDKAIKPPTQQARE